MSSVLRGLDKRTKGNIESEQKFDINKIEEQNFDDKISEFDSDNKDIDVEKKTKTIRKGNQYAQVKISKSMKNELDALKTIEKTKFDYEILQLLIDSYVRNELSTANRKKFKLLVELSE